MKNAVTLEAEICCSAPCCGFLPDTKQVPFLLILLLFWTLALDKSQACKISFNHDFKMTSEVR